jgi:hypothetical protein
MGSSASTDRRRKLRGGFWILAKFGFSETYRNFAFFNLHGGRLLPVDERKRFVGRREGEGRREKGGRENPESVPNLGATILIFFFVCGARDGAIL